MKFLPLLLANLGRKKIRTTLTLCSFLVALFLFGLLATVRTSFNQGVEVAGADRVMVINRASIIQPLPVAYYDRIKRIPGVKAVTHASWFGGVYRDPSNFFPQFAVEAESWHAMYPEFVIPDDQWAAFLADRAGCIVGRATAERYGFKVGDRVPINGTIYQGLWEFNVRGIYSSKRPTDDVTQFWFRSDYLYERGPEWAKGRVGWYIVRVADPDQAVAVTQAVDERFANSAYETRTQSEKAMAASFAKQMGNIEFLLLSIGGVVFFTLLLVTGNTMAGAVRERTGELAVLKAMGYTDTFVLTLVLAESCLIAALGGWTGLALMKLLTLGDNPLGAMLPIFYLPPSAIAVGALLTLAVGLLAGLLPALSARRLQVVEALRKL